MFGSGCFLNIPGNVTLCRVSALDLLPGGEASGECHVVP